MFHIADIMTPIKNITFAVNTSKAGAEDAARYLAGIVEGEGGQTQITTVYPLLVTVGEIIVRPMVLDDFRVVEDKKAKRSFGAANVHRLP